MLLLCQNVCLVALISAFNAVSLQRASSSLYPNPDCTDPTVWYDRLVTKDVMFSQVQWTYSPKSDLNEHVCPIHSSSSIKYFAVFQTEYSVIDR